ncbi:MAG: hypothetical protein ABWX56_01610 [Mycetocola sp.]
MSTSPRNEISTGWMGWIYFAAAIVFINGMFSFTQGLVLLIGPDTYTSATVNGDLFLFNLATWGWWNLIIGVLLLAVGGALFSGATWARVIAVILAIISAVSQLLLVPVQPFWSLILIAVDIFIIYAVLVHGRELQASRS